MATDFAVFLRRFLTAHLAGLRGCSPNTIASYRDTFKLLIAWFRDERSIPPGKLTLDRIDAAAITGFLNWLEAQRHNSTSTRNQRLAAISSFCTWMQTEDPARMARCQDILAIPAKKQARPALSHLTVEQARLLLAQPDRSTRRGRRDATLLATLYDTAARVQELADLAVRDIRLERPAMAALTGKGRKTRHVPLAGNTISAAGRLPGRAPPGQARPRRSPGVLRPAPGQAQPRRHRMDHPQIPGPDTRSAARRQQHQPAHPAPLCGGPCYVAGSSISAGSRAARAGSGHITQRRIALSVHHDQKGRFAWRQQASARYQLG